MIEPEGGAIVEEALPNLPTEDADEEVPGIPPLGAVPQPSPRAAEELLRTRLSVPQDPAQPDFEPTSASLSQTGPTPSNHLLELRKWILERQLAEEERQLQEIHDKFILGDTQAIYGYRATNNGDATPVLPTLGPSNLPKPKEPTVYKKKDRAEFNRWERDCEGFFLRSPQSFSTEEKKVDFGVMYISETLKSLWKSHIDSLETDIVQSVPNWAMLKQVMLDALGTESERQQLAYDQLKKAKQRQGQSPTELLEYLRPLWEELGTTLTKQGHIQAFVSALRADIQKDLLLAPPAERNTLTKVEQRAMIIYRRLPSSLSANEDRKPLKEASEGPSGYKVKKRPFPSQRMARGGGESKRHHRGGRSPQDGARDPKPAQNGASNDVVTCYGCGQPGHIRPNCPKDKQGTSSHDESKPPYPGKGKGQ